MTPYEILITQKEILALDDSAPIIGYKNNAPNELKDLPSCKFVFKNLWYQNDANTLRFLTDRNMILMQFCLQGECLYKSTNGKKSISFKNSTYNILYIPEGEFHLTSIGQNVNLLHIYIDESFFFRQMPENHLAFKSKDTNTFDTVFVKNLYINGKLTNILNEITTCEFDGHLKILYLKAKVIELIMLQLAQAEEEKTITLAPTHIEKMMEVKNLIENNLHESYSLAYLARLAGTNEQYLKKHFKMLYGNTVFGYMLACKMQKAKDMLLNEQHRIAEVAETVGYRHATHFTNAFKKFFGYLPRVLRTKILFGGYFSLNIELQFLEVLIGI